MTDSTSLTGLNVHDLIVAATLIAETIPCMTEVEHDYDDCTTEDFCLYCHGDVDNSKSESAWTQRNRDEKKYLRTHPKPETTWWHLQVEDPERDKRRRKFNRDNSKWNAGLMAALPYPPEFPQEFHHTNDCAWVALREALGICVTSTQQDSPSEVTGT